MVVLPLCLVFTVLVLSLRIHEVNMYIIPFIGHRSSISVHRILYDRRVLFKLQKKLKTQTMEEKVMREERLVEFVKIFKSFGIGTTKLKELLKANPPVFSYNTAEQLQQKLEFINREIKISQADSNFIDNILPSALQVDFLFYPGLFKSVGIKKKPITSSSPAERSKYLDEPDVNPTKEKIDVKKMMNEMFGAKKYSWTLFEEYREEMKKNETLASSSSGSGSENGSIGTNIVNNETTSKTSL
jgi:hypothetical protein